MHVTIIDAGIREAFLRRLSYLLCKATFNFLAEGESNGGEVPPGGGSGSAPGIIRQNGAKQLGSASSRDRRHSTELEEKATVLNYETNSSSRVDSG